MMSSYLKNRYWLVYAILAALTWGVWGILTKFISSDIGPFATHLMFTAGALLTLPLIIRRCKIKEFNIKGILIGVGTGILAVLGNVSVYQSFKMGGQAAVVIPFTNLYPLVTILIAIMIFKEKLNWINGVGIFIVVPAIIIMSGQSQIFSDPVHFLQNIGLKIWLLYASVSLLLFGLFSASQKLITNYLSTGWSYVSFVTSSVLVSVFFIAFGLIDFHIPQKSFWYGSMAGFLDGLGVLAIFSAYHARGKASKVSAIAGTLQQVFTVFLALLFLGESIDLPTFSGIFMAILGSLLLSWEKKQNPEISTPREIVKSKNDIHINNTL
jgi:drug/metabolite transporter (DMT)-like permease